MREIGSNFWINPNDNFKDAKELTPNDFGIDGSDFCFLSTGRSAISLALQEIELRKSDISKIAVVPPFTCETVLQPFLKLGYEIKTYPINEEMGVKGEEFRNCIITSQAGVLLFHRYFGFDTMQGMEDTFREIRNRGVYVIEDRTQCLYSEVVEVDVDFFVGSIRKWHGVPDGGFVACKEGEIRNKPFDTDDKLEDAKIEAAYAKYRYLFEHIGEKEVFLDKFRIAEEILDCQSKKFKMSSFSYAMQSSLDVDELKCKRRANFTTLAEGINNPEEIKLLFSECKNEFVPLYFPILVRRREQVQKALREREIYAPIVWPRPEGLPSVCDAAKRCYRDMLCIPIDQRYGKRDMNRIIDIINEEKHVISH